MSLLSLLQLFVSLLQFDSQLVGFVVAGHRRGGRMLLQLMSQVANNTLLALVVLDQIADATRS